MGFFDNFLNDPNIMRALIGGDVSGSGGGDPNMGPGFDRPYAPIMPPQQPPPQQAQIGTPGGLAPRQAPFPGAPPQMPQQGLPGSPSGPAVDPTGPPGGMVMTPREAAGGSPGGPLADAAGIGGIGSDAARTPGIPQPSWGGGAPSPAGPPPVAPPTGPPGGAPPPMMQPPGGQYPFSGAIGAPQQQPNFMQRFGAGLGPGLTAASNSWNKPGLAAAMGGAGGAIEGGTKELTRQRAEDRETAKQHFDQSSTAFKDVLAERAAGNMEDYRKAQAKYLGARADALAAGGTARGSNAWQATPYGKMLTIEKTAQSAYADREKTMREQFKLNSTPEQAQQAALAELDKQREAYKQRLYQQAGIDPNAQKKLRTLGQSADNPFEPKNAEELHHLVPENGWFKDPASGKVMKFTRPAWDKYGPKKSEAVPPSGAAAANNDDLAAMSG